MPNWSEILVELDECKRVDALDFVRRKYLRRANEITGRNVIAYYSSFLQKPNLEQGSIDDNDKNGFMAVIHKMDRSKGLDLILHTPGGNLAATESIVDYLKHMFGNNIRAIIPQIAMSAGTMIACSCKTIVMGKQSNLGPIDPQLNGISAPGVVEEFKRAATEIKGHSEKIPIWQVIISRYHPTFIGECEKAIEWSNQIMTKWLLDNMLSGDSSADKRLDSIMKYISSHSETMSHSRHIGIDECERIGLNIERLESLYPEQDYQDCILSIHHSFMHSFSNSPAVKIIENHNETAMVLRYNPQPQAIQLQNPQTLVNPEPIFPVPFEYELTKNEEE